MLMRIHMRFDFLCRGYCINEPVSRSYKLSGEGVWHRYVYVYPGHKGF
jgi:hypothetical protein